MLSNTVTLITFDGFVKQMNYTPSCSRYIRIPTLRKNYRVGYEHEVFDPTQNVTFDVREFHQVGNTTVYQER